MVLSCFSYYASIYARIINDGSSKEVIELN